MLRTKNSRYFRRLVTAGQSGDTIVEVLIAIAIAAFAIGISYATANRSLQQAIYARERNEALNVIQNQVTDLKFRRQKTPSDASFASFAYPQVKNFCLSNSIDPSSPNWQPILNNDAAATATALSAPANPATANNPFNSGCVYDSKYYIDIVARSVGGSNVNPTVYEVIVRWEPLSGTQLNQASVYYRLGGFGGVAFNGGGSNSPPPNTADIDLGITVLGHPNLTSLPELRVVVDGVIRYAAHDFTMSELSTTCPPSQYGSNFPHSRYGTTLPSYGSNYDLYERCTDFPIQIGNVPMPSKITVQFAHDSTGWNTSRSGCPPAEQSDDICWEDNNIIINSLTVSGNHTVKFDNYDNGSHQGEGVPEPPSGATMPPYHLWMNWSGSAVFDVT